MSSGTPLKGAGRVFVSNLFWMLAMFGPLAAIIILAAGLPLLKMLAFVGIFVSVLAALVTLLAL